MPYPKNLQTAVEVEAVVRETGAVPATIAILDGLPHVGQFQFLSASTLLRMSVNVAPLDCSEKIDILAPFTDNHYIVCTLPAR
jgi:pseudouridine-5'-phosphate glycosidase